MPELIGDGEVLWAEQPLSDVVNTMNLVVNGTEHDTTPVSAARWRRYAEGGLLGAQLTLSGFTDSGRAAKVAWDQAVSAPDARLSIVERGLSSPPQESWLLDPVATAFGFDGEFGMPAPWSAACMTNDGLRRGHYVAELAKPAPNTAPAQALADDLWLSAGSRVARATLQLRLLGGPLSGGNAGLTGQVTNSGGNVALADVFASQATVFRSTFDVQATGALAFAGTTAWPGRMPDGSAIRVYLYLHEL